MIPGCRSNPVDSTHFDGRNQSITFDLCIDNLANACPVVRCGRHIDIDARGAHALQRVAPMGQTIGVDVEPLPGRLLEEVADANEILAVLAPRLSVIVGRLIAGGVESTKS